MSKKLLYLLLIVLTIIAGTYFYLTCCSTCGADIGDKTPVEKVVAAPVVPESTAYPFAFSDGDYAYRSQDNINFNVSNFSILDSVAPKVDAGIFSLKKYLDTNLDKAINITGFYKSDETNASAFPNLGIARANAIKNYFTTKGVASSQINILGELKDALTPKDNILFGPASYTISDKVTEDMAPLAAKIKANPLVLYFNTGQAAINLSADQRQKIADISTYLDKVDGASCNIIGHTDNEGNRTSNIALGQQRAEFAKEYLIKNGIPGIKINPSSKGPDTPIESNATAEGRAKNRRTVITLN